MHVNKWEHDAARQLMKVSAVQASARDGNPLVTPSSQRKVAGFVRIVPARGRRGSVTFGRKGKLVENSLVGNDYLTPSEMGPTWD